MSQMIGENADRRSTADISSAPAMISCWKTSRSMSEIRSTTIHLRHDERAAGRDPRHLSRQDNGRAVLLHNDRRAFLVAFRIDRRAMHDRNLPRGRRIEEQDIAAAVGCR